MTTPQPQLLGPCEVEDENEDEDEDEDEVRNHNERRAIHEAVLLGTMVMLMIMQLMLVMCRWKQAA